ncbi:MAG: hypothetical protein R3222_06570 [Balneolaceae bacterium]|nr:hypothetical protein [Balneolaceae bacterium]
MSKDQKEFSKKQKTSIALKAKAGGDEAIEKLAEEHNISEEQIRNWIEETGVATVQEEDEEVSIQATDTFADFVKYGATFDNLNYRRLTFWSIFGLATILVFVLAIIYVYDYTMSSMEQRADRTQYYEIEQLKENDQIILESYGVVDPEEGIYRIPVDSAISLIANE